MTKRQWLNAENWPLRLTALITWLMVSIIMLFDQADLFLRIDEIKNLESANGVGNKILLALFLLIYYLGSVVAMWQEVTPENIDKCRLGVLIMGLSTFPIAWLNYIDFQLILIVIFAGTLPRLMSIASALLMIVVLHASVVSLLSWRWYSEFPWINLILYFVFCIFAMVSNNISQRERKARQQLDIAHKQLLATQQLLTDSAIQDERLRIARDLHDAIGHHLTALSLQLEVAKKVAKDKIVDHVEQAQAIAKLLLAEVRQVVTDIRSVPNLDIRNSLQQLAESSIVKTELIIDDNIKITNALAAETFFRLVQEIITNSNRHSRSSVLNINLSESSDSWRLQADDGGSSKVVIVPGSGIQGMRERVQQLGGSFVISADRGLHYDIELPKHD